MPDYPERSVSRAAIRARRLAWFSAALFATAGLAHRFGLLETPGFVAVLAIVPALALLALVFAAFGFLRLWHHGDQGGKNIAAAVVLSAVVLTPFGLMTYRAAIHPVLNDISTDLDDPPEFPNSRRNLSAGMNPLFPPTSEQKQAQMENYPQITGRRYDLQFERMTGVVSAAVKAEGWTVVRQAEVTEEVETTLEAVAYTPLFGFPSDVAIRLTDEGDTTYVDMRSASRYGDSDLGDNAARIAAFLDRLGADVSGLAGTLPRELVDDDTASEEPADIPLPEPRPNG